MGPQSDNTDGQQDDITSTVQAVEGPSAGPAKSSVPAPTEPEEAFESFYLRQATREFADDLEKLRAASDFKEGRSVQLLVEALKQGAACFGTSEREKIGRAALRARGA